MPHKPLLPLRAHLALHTIEPGPTRLILALAHELPPDVEHWSATATLSQLAERCGVNERTVRRWRDRLPDLPWLELMSSSRGYHLRISLTGSLASPLPADILPGPHLISTSAPALSGQLTREDARTLLGQMAVMARTLVGQYPDILDSLPGHDVDILRTLAEQPADTTRTTSGHLADNEGANPGHSADIARTLGGHPADISRTSSGHYSDISRTLPGHFADISHVGARTITPRVHAPVILKKDSLQSSFLSEQGLPCAHEGAHTHEGQACSPADEVQGLEGWIQERLAERLERYVQRPTLVEAEDIEDFAAQLVERLGDALVAQRYLEDRLLQIAGRPEDKRPVSWSFMVRFLLADTSNEQLVAQAQAAAQPVAAFVSSASPAQPAAHIAPSRGRREKFRAPQFAQAFEAIAQPEAPVTSEQERQSWREQLSVELSMPSHHQQDELVALLVELLGDEGQEQLTESQRPELVEAPASPPEQPAPEEAPEPAMEQEQAPEPAMEQAPEPAMEQEQAPEPTPLPTTKPSSPYSPFPFAQLSQELGYNRSAPKRPEPCLDVVKLWPSLLDALRAHGVHGHGLAQMLDGAQTLELDVEAQQLRVGLEDADFVKHVMSFDMLPYRIALLERLELRTKPGWRLIASLAQSQEEVG